MSDAVGRAVIETVVDASPMKAGIEEAKRSVRALGAELGTSVADGSAKASRSIDAYIAKLEQSASTVGMTSREVKILELTQRGATDAQLAAADAALRTVESFKAQQIEARKAADAARTGAAVASASLSNQGNTTKLTAQQTQQLSYQLNDLFVQIASGQSPLTAIIQQGSQLNGTFGGIGGTLRALGTLFTATNVIVGGVAITIGALGYQAFKGREEIEALNKALALTGGYTGQTTQQLTLMADRIALKGNVSEARQALTELVSTGKVAGDQLESFGRVALLMSKSTGEGLDKVAANLADLGDDAVKWAEKYNQQYHFMTAAQYELAKGYQDAGDKAGAAKVILESLQGAQTKLAEDGAKQIGTLKRWYDEWLVGINKIKSAMASWGAPDSDSDKLNEQLVILQKREEALAEARKRGNTAGIEAGEAMIRGTKSLIEQLRERLALTKEMTKEEAAVKAATTASINVGKYLDSRKNATPAVQRSLAIQDETREFNEAIKDLDKGSQNYKDAVARHASNLKQINDSYASKSGAAGRDTRKEDLDQLLSKEKLSLDGERGIYEERLQMLKLYHDKFGLSESDYYQGRIAARDEYSAAEVASYEAQSNLVADFDSKTDKEAEATQARLDEMFRSAMKIYNKLRAERQNDLSDEAASLRKKEQAIADYKSALDSKLGTAGEERDIAVASIGTGDMKTQQAARLNALRREYDAEYAKLVKEKSNNPERENEYDQKIEALKKYHADRIALEIRTNKDLAEERGRWDKGANKALENYLASAADIAGQTENLFGNAFQGMEDAIVQFSMTGKLSFSDFARSVIADIIRIQARQQIAGIATSAMSALGGLFDTSTRSAEMSRITAQASAAGGYDIPAGVNPVVQTHAREMILPEHLADVVRNMAAGGGGGGGGLKVVINNNASNVAQAEARPAADGSGLEIFINAIKNSIGEDIAYGSGPVNAAIQGRYGLRPSIG